AGTLTANENGTFTFAPAQDWSGSLDLTYQVSDGVASATASATINVGGVADRPNLSVFVGEGQTEDSTSGFTVQNLGSDAGYHNTYGYYVTDESGAPTVGHVIWGDVKDSAGQSVTISGVDADRVGFFLIPNGDGRQSIASGETLSFTQDASGNWHAVNGNGQTLLGSGGADVLFSDNSLNAGGAYLETDSSAVGGNQNWEDIAGSGSDRDFNDFKVDIDWRGEGNGATTYPLTIESSLSDLNGGESLSVTVSGLPEGAVLSRGALGEDGVWTLSASDMQGLTLTTPAGFTGSLDFSVKATASENGTTAQTDVRVAVDVTGDANAAPVAEAGDEDVVMNTAYAGRVQAADVDGDALTYSIADNGGPAHGSLQLNPDGTYIYRPAGNFTGADAFTYTVSDGEGGTATARIELDVARLNRDPATAGADVDSREDTALSGQLAATDPDRDSLTFSLARDGSPANGTLSLDANGSYTYTPNANFNGNDSFTYTVSDGFGGTATGTAHITVAAVNDAPVVSGSVSLAGTEDQSFSFTTAQLLANASDVDNARTDLTVTDLALSNPDAGNLTSNGNGTFTFTPLQDWNGLLDLSYKVSDGAAAAQASAHISVAAVDDAPVDTGIVPPAVYHTHDFSFSVADSFRDPDGGPLTFSARIEKASGGGGETSTDWLHFDAPTGIFYGTPPNAGVGVNVTVTATDASGQAVSKAFVLDPSQPDVLADWNGGNDARTSTDDGVVTFKGSKEDDAYSGGSGGDFIFGGDGNDVLNGGAGDDYMFGGDSAVKSPSATNGGEHGDGGGRHSSSSSGDGGTHWGTGWNWGGRSPSSDGGHDGHGRDGSGGRDSSSDGGHDRHGRDSSGGRDSSESAAVGDVLHGNAGNDTVAGGSGDDVLYGDEGNDHLFGDAGEDVLFGGSGSDHLFGGDGGDALFGGDGSDALFGGGGSDVLQGGGGSDVMRGGDGQDIFSFGPSDGGMDLITDFQIGEGGDMLDLSGLVGDNTSSDFVRLGFNSSGKLTVSVDTDGAGEADAFHDVVTLDNVTRSDDEQASAYTVQAGTSGSDAVTIVHHVPQG
ncbi:MAG: tandem-95 repeat protein, partial [Alphaproteobacteria bacterium]|nr:tandem-95 repeat protein [Alphaproteobacteria bacterium]